MKNCFAKGFTLIELILYVGLVGFFLTTVSMLVFQFIEGGNKVQTYQEVQHNTRFALQRVVQEIRSANDINIADSTFGSHPGRLSLASDDSGKNPTIFDVSNNQLRIQYGTGSPTALTSSKVKVTNLIFTDRSVSGRTQNIKIQLTIESLNPAGVNMFDADLSLEATAAVREKED